GSGRNDGLGPAGFLLDFEIGHFPFRRRRVIAAVEPHKKARMGAQTEHLIAKRRYRDLFCFFVPLAPFFPGVATAPAGHDRMPSRSARSMKDSSSSFPSRRIVLSPISFT